MIFGKRNHSLIIVSEKKKPGTYFVKSKCRANPKFGYFSVTAPLDFTICTALPALRALTFGSYMLSHVTEGK